MARFDPAWLSGEEAQKLLTQFYKAVTLIENYEDAKLFFNDLLTLKETAMLARRLQIATMILFGYTYQEIQEALKVGVPTIAKVQKWLEVGGEGYKTIIRRLIKQNTKDQKLKEMLKDPFSWANFKSKYAGHFLVEETLKELGVVFKRRAKRKSIPKEV